MAERVQACGDYTAAQIESELTLAGPGVYAVIRQDLSALSEHSLEMLARALASAHLSGRISKMQEIKTVLEIP